ncbi:ABC transporter ATP-binding protein [Ruminococcus flavefaciens]|uniref:ABC transporter ATP-binding protein n=1 Tax=Ruminococcus flavefaciens TaxID=1265 RepID=UPI00048D0FDD|nr:ABC transporter ATP-binding protein [Ruminococcus flavefaciens]
MFIEIKKLNKSYGEGDNKIKVINNVSLDIEKGTICMIIGASGSGKSTFLNLIGAMDVADSGSIVIDGKDITKLKAAKLTDYRREYLGYIFQFYNLIPDLTVLENIETTQYLGKDNMDIDELIRLLGLEEHKNKFPSQLSGGQQQRCAIGRALVKKPSILLCDEPTGALDSKTSQDILELLEEVNEKFGTTIIMVTHNNDITCMADHIVVFSDGKIVRSSKNKNKRSIKGMRNSAL